jgi:hypothetical protein
MIARVAKLLLCGCGVMFLMFCTTANEPEKAESGMYRLDITIAGSGTVSDSEKKCAKVCSFMMNKDKEVTLSAIPVPEWRFVEWLGDCSGTGDCTLTMTENKEVTAVFTYP